MKHGSFKHCLAVSSGKGGVGKSTVTAKIATTWAKEGIRVGVLDADLYGPSQRTLLGVSDPVKLAQLEDHSEIFIPPVANGVKTISMSLLSSDREAASWRGPILHQVLNQFINGVAWGELDILLLDLPPGTGDVQLSLSELMPIDAAVVVTTPQELSLQDVRRGIALWESVKIPVLGVIENMSYFLCDDCSKKHFLWGDSGGKRLAEKYHLPLLSQLPFDPILTKNCDRGKPIENESISEEIQLLSLKILSSLQEIKKLTDANPPLST